MGIGSHMVMVFKNVGVAAKFIPNKQAKKHHDKSVEKTKKKHAKLESSRAGRRGRGRPSKKSKNGMILALVFIAGMACYMAFV